MQTNGFATADKVNNFYLGLGIKEDMFLALFDKYNTDFARKAGFNRTKASLSRYKTIRSHTADYVRKEFHRDDVYI